MQIVGLKGWEFSREQGAQGAEDRFRDEASALGEIRDTAWYMVLDLGAGVGSWPAGT